MKVVVAGRVSAVSDDIPFPDDVVWAGCAVCVDWLVCVGVVPVDVWAAALDATASVNAAANMIRFLNIRTASKTFHCRT
jgi:hypothetical protein